MGKADSGCYPTRGNDMLRCSHPQCSWRAIAPSEEAAWPEYAQHLVETHSTTVDADIPEGMVQLKFDDDGDWITVSVEEAGEIQREGHDED